MPFARADVSSMPFKLHPHRMMVFYFAYVCSVVTAYGERAALHRAAT